jgi:ADP-ribose pyrophosphatase YjhB (NUDIX family)
MAAGALLLNQAGAYLLVKPSYRQHWLIPGGVIEDQESPSEACQREIREELRLELPISQLLCIEYKTVKQVQGTYRENLQFIFYGGVLTSSQIQQIRLPAQELTAYNFCPLGRLSDYLSPRLAHRLTCASEALAQNRLIYLENGQQLVTA